MIQRIAKRVNRELVLLQNHWRIRSLRKDINKLPGSNSAPVLFFNASTRLSGLSQNAGFSLITSLALEADGVPVVHVVCERGLSRCVLGTNKDNPHALPPCTECMRTSRLIFDPAQVESLNFKRDLEIANQIKDLPLSALLEYQIDDFNVGALILPSLRWILRRHHLNDDENTCFLAREYILSAWNLKNEIERILKEIAPRAVVVFNGMTYPEAVVRWAARQVAIPVYSHEVGMLPFSAFFTDKEATAYPVKVDASLDLSEAQNKKLDEYLQQRFEGKFVTAGVKFWPEMKTLDEDVREKIKTFKAIVPIFTNVIFDTSQSHANIIFDQMFDWLDTVLVQIKTHTETLFIIRAHPDELRPGKESRETVAAWVASRLMDQLPNVLFIPSDKFISSYDLIRIAKFVMVYNSTVGLEASIMGKPVLCAGQARYTRIPTVFFPDSREGFHQTFLQFLDAEDIENPQEFLLNARRVLYSQLFRASLPFDQFLEDDGVWQGYVRFKKFELPELTADKSDTIQVIINGIINNQPFIRDL